MDSQHTTRDLSQVSLTGVIITLGIVYGDLGTSPLYTMQAIVGGLSSLDPLWIIGSLSCIIWTLTL
jgi:KUP system potassium uptake protein